MYKRASQNLQHAHGVDNHRRGFVFHDIEADLLPCAANLGPQECREELAQITREMIRINQALAIARREGDKEQASFLGQQYQSLIQRRSPINKRLMDLKAQSSEQCLGDAVREVADHDTQRRIFDRARSLVEERFGS